MRWESVYVYIFIHIFFSFSKRSSLHSMHVIRNILHGWCTYSNFRRMPILQSSYMTVHVLIFPLSRRPRAPSLECIYNIHCNTYIERNSYHIFHQLVIRTVYDTKNWCERERERVRERESERDYRFILKWRNGMILFWYLIDVHVLIQ